VAACSSSDGGAGAGKTSVVASFYPLEEAATRIGGDRVAVTNLTAPGVEPHDLELNPDQVDAILDADVVLYLGSGFQPAVEDALADAGGEAVDLLEGFPLAESADEEEHGPDPHVWLDPTLMARIARRVRDALGEADPGGASTFGSNAETYVSELGELDEAFQSGLTGCARDLIVAAHAAFGYLAARYDLRQEAITGISPEAEPDPARLAELVDLVEREGVTTIFTEELVSPEVAETLAREAGVTTDVLNPLEGLTPDEVAAGDDYASFMRENLEALRRALGCP
ncbi:MAG TPA: zinc ABC transporter substrate-binding protein, partial [Actinomycetota bacterium]|nr:zinc ABC transporter substrate-binding protein [Actinomycetota bacterium]